MPESLWDISRVVEVGAVLSMSPRERLDARARLGLAARAADSAAASAALGEIAARRVFWSKQLVTQWRLVRTPGFIILVIATVLALWIVPVLGCVTLVLLLVVITFGFAVSSKFAHDRDRLLAAIHEGVCPDCGYAVARDIPGGPDACSECGSPWPLVPPGI